MLSRMVKPLGASAHLGLTGATEVSTVSSSARMALIGSSGWGADDLMPAEMARHSYVRSGQSKSVRNDIIKTTHLRKGKKLSNLVGPAFCPVGNVGPLDPEGLVLGGEEAGLHPCHVPLPEETSDN